MEMPHEGQVTSHVGNPDLMCNLHYVKNPINPVLNSDSVFAIA